MTEAPETSWAGRLDGGGHVLRVRVYYEDTDFSGAVYHANYLKFCERGRSDYLRLLGIEHAALLRGDWGRPGTGFVVRRMQIEFLRPAGIDDLLDVRSRFTALSGARMKLHQTVSRGDATLFDARLEIAMTGPDGRPVRVPDAVKARLTDHLAGDGPA